MANQNPKYKGKNFNPNFADPRAEKSQPDGGQQSERKPIGKPKGANPARKISKTLPPPRNTAGMNDPTPLRDAPIYKESIFETDMSVRENNMRSTVTPATFGLVPTVETIWSEMIADNSNLDKEMLKEGLHYYASALLWLRIIQLKKANKHSLSEAETMVASLCETTDFYIPSPLHVYLQSLGTVKCTGTGQTLIPTFPQLPEQVIADYGGYFGAMGEATHNLYEEFPCLGVTGETLRHALSDEEPGHYASSLAFEGCTVNENLLGYAPLIQRKHEAKNPFLNLGVTDVIFPESVENTGFNYDVVHMVSTWVETTITFKIEKLNISLMTSIGSQSQTIIENPNTTGTVGALRNVMGQITATSLIRETVTVFGVAQYTLFQMNKVSAQNARESASIRSRSWCCINFTAELPIPNAWIVNRNERRANMPREYLATRFETLSENNNNLRQRIVEKMVIAKR